MGSERDGVLLVERPDRGFGPSFTFVAARECEREEIDHWDYFLLPFSPGAVKDAHDEAWVVAGNRFHPISFFAAPPRWHFDKLVRPGSVGRTLAPAASRVTALVGSIYRQAERNPGSTIAMMRPAEGRFFLKTPEKLLNFKEDPPLFDRDEISRRIFWACAPLFTKG
jgi:hypothetical protein